MRRTAPAAAAAAPAGISPTSSAPETSTPRARASALDSIDDLVQGRRFVVLDVHADLRTTGSRQEQPECAHTGETATLLPHDCCDCPRYLHIVGGEVHVERDQRPARADDDTTGALVESRRTEVRAKLARVDTALELRRASAPVERGAPLRRRVAVEEHRAGRARRRSDPRAAAHSPAPARGRADRARRSARRLRRRFGDERLRARGGRSARARRRFPPGVLSTSEVSSPTSVKTDRL